jgi:hypothetical protein
MEKVNESFTYGVILDSFILAYVKYETKLIEKQEVLSQYGEFCEVNNHSSIEMSLTQKNIEASVIHFYCIRNK